MSGTSEVAQSVAAGAPRPQRTISDEFHELQSIVNRFQSQLDAADGIVGLHPFGPVNVEQTQVSFAQACRRLRESLTTYRDTTLASWNQLFVSNTMQHPHLANSGVQAGTLTATATNRAAAAIQELGEMRKVADLLHEDLSGCQKVLFNAAGDAISRTLTDEASKSPTLLVDRLKASAKRLGLAHYTDVQRRDGSEVTTVTLAGGISVIDVDIGSAQEHMKVKVSYVSDIDHDPRIDVLMLGRLQCGDIHGFERLVEEMATLDRLTRDKSPVNFIHNTFAVAATLAEIQKQELAALDGDMAQVLRYGSGIALPYTRHVGPSTAYFMPAAVRHGLSEQDWAGLRTNSLSAAADLPQCLWLDFAWEPSNTQHCFLSEKFQQYCVDPDAIVDDSGALKVASHQHPSIHGLEMRFLEISRTDAPVSTSDAMQVEQGLDSGFWIPYALVARVAPSLPACALTVRAIMAATGQSADDTVGASQDSPRVLEDAPTLERFVHASCAPRADAPFSAVHRVDQTVMRVQLDTPQIRVWSVSRIPITRMQQVLAIVPLLRRQAL
ncbi:hypothetical protein IWW50_005139, partial [Coemansia erecta]